MKTPVNFELAKLLKEKGFICHNSDKFWKDGFSFEKKDYNPIAYKDKDNVGNIADVVMWLYEEHDIWITVERHEPKALFNYVIIYQDKVAVKESRGKGYSSPTEAYEAAIIYTLNNLI